MEGMGGFAGYNDSQRAWDTSQQAKLTAQKTLLDIQKERGALEDSEAASTFWKNYSAQQLLSQVKGTNRSTTTGTAADGTSGGPAVAGPNTTLQDASNFAIRNRAPWSVTGPLIKASTEEQVKNAEIANTRSNQKLHELEASKELVSIFGTVSYAGSQSAEAYNQTRLAVAQDRSLPEEVRQFFAKLPQNTDEGQAILANKAKMSMQMKDSLEQTRKDTADTRTAALDAANIKLSEARTALVAARRREVERTTARKIKTEGPTSEAAAQEKQLGIQIKQFEVAAKRAEFLPVPSGWPEAQLTPGIKYQLPDGTTFVYTMEKQIQVLSGPMKVDVRGATGIATPEAATSADDEEQD